MTLVEQLEQEAKRITKQYFGDVATDKQYNMILAAVAAGSSIALEYSKESIFLRSETVSVSQRSPDTKGENDGHDTSQIQKPTV